MKEKILAAVMSGGGAPGTPTTVPQPSHEALRFGVLLDAESPAERIADFDAQLRRGLDEIDAALSSKEADAVARGAHRLVSQVLSIHHHTFADQLRALEQCAAHREWDKADSLQSLNREAAKRLSSTLKHLRQTLPVRGDAIA